MRERCIAAREHRADGDLEDVVCAHTPEPLLQPLEDGERVLGDKVGVVDGEARFTYRQFAERTHRLAQALRTLGIEPGDRVSFITYNTHHLLEAYYGVLEAGAVLNPINIRLTPHEIGYILEHAGSKLVAFHDDFRPLVDAIAPTLTRRPRFVILEGEPRGVASDEYEALLASGTPDPLHPAIDENAVAELFYTSGTTGLPKGVALTHRQLYLHAVSAQLGLGFEEDDVILHVVPLFHVNGWGVPHFLTMIGGRHVMLRRFEPVALMEAVERHRVTRLLGVPAIFNAVVHHRDRSRHDLSSLRQVIIGGSPASPSLVRALEEALGVEAYVGYGLSETSPILTLARPRRVVTDAEAPERRQERQAMTGWPIPGGIFGMGLVLILLAAASAWLVAHFGHEAYGIAAAAKIYFGVTDLSKLTPAQAAAAGLTISSGLTPASSNFFR